MLLYCKTEVWLHSIKVSAMSLIRRLFGFANVLAEEQANLVLFETWPRRDGHAVFSASHEQGFKPPKSQQEMLTTLQQTYWRGAAQNGAIVAPVGTCWVQAHDTNRLYAADGSHASKAGAGLAARVIERTISGTAQICD